MSGTAPSGPSAPRSLSLTFDDGPDPTWTPRVLEQLARCKVTASFFMVGERVRAERELARLVLVAGHEIQLHCDRHVRHTELTDAELLLDTETALDALATVGVRPQLWRAPWGVCTEASIQVAEQLGLQLVRWSIDTHDWRGDQPQQMLAHARRQVPYGGSVLMHDAIGPGASRTGCENTIALLPALTSAARAQGLDLSPMHHQAQRTPRANVELEIGAPA